MLPEIERAAARLFPDNVLTTELRESTVPIKELEAAYAEGRLWTATTTSGKPVGFAIAIRELNRAFLQEVNVHSGYQKKGLGRRLILKVIGWAQAQGSCCVTLTTFGYLPWNAPFYSRLGFRELAENELNPELLVRLQAERRQGLEQRVAMQYTLGVEHPGHAIQVRVRTEVPDGGCHARGGEAPLQDSIADVKRFIADHESWVIEGCYADIIEPILNECDELLFLKPRC